jgi:hypothetical protein
MCRVSALAVAAALGLWAAPSLAHAQGAPLGQAAQFAPHPAPPGQGCFGRQEQRMEVLQGHAIRLGFAMRAIRPQDGDELLRAELCRNSSGLVYVLTLLSRNGKVSRAVIDARTGAVIKER